MKVSFIAKRKRIKFTAHPRKHKTPKQLKPFLFKKRTKRLKLMLKKAKKGWTAWRRRSK